MREFDNEQKINLYVQIGGNIFALLLLALSYNFISTHLGELMDKAMIIILIVLVFSFSFTAIQIYRYRNSKLFVFEKLIKYCKKNSIPFELIEETENRIYRLTYQEKTTEISYKLNTFKIIN